MMFSHANVGIAPSSRPIWNQIAADFEMKLKNEFFTRKWMHGELTGGNGTFRGKHTLGKERCELGIRQEPVSGFNETG